MSSPGLTRGVKKGLRSIVQVAAGGALTALVTALAGGLAPSTQALVMGAWIAFVAFSQNWAEGAGKIGVLLPTPALVSGPTVDAVATVEAVADRTGGIVGAVLDTAGDVVGEVTGQLDKDPDDGGIPLALIIGIGILVILIGGFGLCGDALFEDEDERNDLGLGRVELADHDYGGGYDEDYDQWNNEDRNRNRNRNRGAFSPGPFDDSPVDAFNGNTICLPGSTCYGDRGNEPPPDEGEPQ